MTPEQLIAEHSTVIWNIAYSFQAACRRSVIVGVDDLYDVGLWAMLEAAQTHDPALSAFKTYYHRKVRWAMVDALRNASFSRRSHRKADGFAIQMLNLSENQWDNLTTPDDETRDDRFQEMCQMSCRALQPKYAARRVLILEMLYGRDGSISEAARQLGCTRQTAQRARRRALQAVRRALAG
jgi:RNA polymerase sigma factor (sigma-70 family)